jgi:hypothetical protein
MEPNLISNNTDLPHSLDSTRLEQPCLHDSSLVKHQQPDSEKDKVFLVSTCLDSLEMSLI